MGAGSDGGDTIAGSDGGDTGPAAAAVGNVAGVITLNQVFRPRTTLWGGGTLMAIGDSESSAMYYLSIDSRARASAAIKRPPFQAAVFLAPLP